MIVGFEEPGSGGSANVYEVDLGSISLFNSNQSFSLSTSDLTSEFGSGWATNSLLQFGVVGGTQTTANGDLTLGSTTYSANTLFITQNTFEAAPTEKTVATQGTSQSDINALYNDVQNSALPSAGSTAAFPAVTTTSSDPGSIAYQNAHNANFNLGTGFANPTSTPTPTGRPPRRTARRSTSTR